MLDAWYLVRLAGLPRRMRVVRPYTLVNEVQLLFLEELCGRLREDDVPGDLVECGVYKGGSAGILGLQAIESPERRLWLFDAFAGMPQPGDKDDAASREIATGYVGSEASTRRIMKRLGVPEGRYRIVVGWLEDTLPELDKPPVALLHIDTDFYDPVKLALEQFYPHVSPGGYVVLNDYGVFEGCRRATDEFLAEHAPGGEVIAIDPVASYFQKPVVDSTS